jgi:type II secretory pathway pseudopilin PulG
MDGSRTMLSHNRPRSRGFTLIEAAITTVIVGVGILATMSLFAACSQQNMNASEMTTAMMLATNVQEAMANMSFSDPIMGKTTFGPEGGEVLGSFDDVDDWDGQTINPPIDAFRAPVSNMSQYSQVVTVDPIDMNNLSLVLPKTVLNRAAVRVRVRVLFQPVAGASSEEVYRTDWVRTER